MHVYLKQLFIHTHLTNTHMCSSEETNHVPSSEIAATFHSAIWPIKSISLGHFNNSFGQNCCIKRNSIKLTESLILYTRSCNENNTLGLPVKMMNGDILTSQDPPPSHSHLLLLFLFSAQIASAASLEQADHIRSFALQHLLQ